MNDLMKHALDSRNICSVSSSLDSEREREREMEREV